jgi:hypothetical protein
MDERWKVIPAQPGWFVFDWEGSRTEFTLTKAPIVAWLIEDLPLVLARPVTTGDFGKVVDVIGPDGMVYCLKNGNCWPDVASYIAAQCDRMDADVAEHERWAEARRQKVGVGK